MGSGFDGERRRSGSVAQPGREPAGGVDGGIRPRVRAAQATSPGEDARAMRSIGRGASRERLRAFLEMAVTAVGRVGRA